MSIANWDHPSVRTDDAAMVAATTRPLHQLGIVRRREGISQATMARRLGISVHEVKRQECETADLPLSKLYKWQEVLRVPLEELLVDIDERLSPALKTRGQMVRLMKTARAVQQRSRELPIRRMAQVLVDQLIELMPELTDVKSWSEFGQPRGLSELGQVVHRRASVTVYREPTGLEE